MTRLESRSTEKESRIFWCVVLCRARWRFAPCGIRCVPLPRRGVKCRRPGAVTWALATSWLDQDLVKDVE
jgi:hypothetical protein